jgi:hypothetical protein
LPLFEIVFWDAGRIMLDGNMARTCYMKLQDEEYEMWLDSDLGNYYRMERLKAGNRTNGRYAPTTRRAR